MRTIKAGSSPRQRIEAGSAVLEAARSIDAAPVKAQLQAFEKIHKAFLAAQAQVDKADDKLAQQQDAIGERDVLQDAALVRLAGALTVEGMPRANPFKPFGFAAPSQLADLGYGDEAKQVKKLAAQVRKRKALAQATLKTLTELEKAAEAVEKALAPRAQLEAARHQAILRRDGLEQTWATRFAALKYAAKAASFDGAPELFKVLFERATPPAPGRSKKPGATTPTPPAPTGTPAA